MSDPVGLDGSSDEDLEPWDLSDEERTASVRGLSPPSTAAPEPPPHQYVREVALRLLFIFGLCLLVIILMSSVIAWFKPESLKDMVSFFGTVIATLGTLLGGVVAFYFSRR